MPDRPPDRFFDTVTLSSFALSGAFDLLIERCGRSLRGTEQVREELAFGRIRGYPERNRRYRRTNSARMVDAGFLLARTPDHRSPVSRLRSRDRSRG